MLLALVPSHTARACKLPQKPLVHYAGLSDAIVNPTRHCTVIVGAAFAERERDCGAHPVVPPSDPVEPTDEKIVR